MENLSTKRKKLKGIIVSDKGDKTVVVMVKRFKKHPRYGKYMTVSKRYLVHDENNDHKVGEEVEIISSKPYSKNKSFCVVKK